MSVKGISTTMYQWDSEYQSRSMGFVENLDMVLGEMASCGLDGVQARLTLAETREEAENLLRLCQEKDLQLSSFYGDCKIYDMADMEEETDLFIEKAKHASDTGCRLIALNMVTPQGRDKTDDEIKCQAEGLGKLGRILGRESIRIAIHNHTSEMSQNAKEFRYLMDNVGEKAIGSCLDISWADKIGVPPMEIIDAYHQRIFEIHVRNNRDRSFTQSVDDGDISYPDLCKKLAAYGYDGWYVIELAYSGDMFQSRPFKENIVRSLWYMKGIAALL